MHAETSRFSKAFMMAVSWNAFFYIIYKISFVVLTFLLYNSISPAAFSCWAATNSIMFLLLLWLNCGLKQSIPRFAPLFSQTPHLFRYFMYGLLLLKSVVLIAGIPLLHSSLAFLLPNSFLPRELVTFVFLSEGLSSLLLLIYHAHFWQKQFNLIQTFFLLFEMIRNFTFFYQPPFSQETLIKTLLYSKLFGNVGTIFFALAFIPFLYKGFTLQVIAAHQTTPRALFNAFIKHSSIMWVVCLIQSFSERNFLFPLVHFFQGSELANLFKVVHDAAIFFQRITLKTIGIADTALLSYIEVGNHRRLQLTNAFLSIFKTVFVVSVPCLFLGTVLFFKKQFILLPSPATSLFLIVAISSAVEMVLSPYARMLEVKLAYKELFYAYAPYLVGIMLAFYAYATGQTSLLMLITVLHGLRLFCALLQAISARKLYRLEAPRRFIIITGIASSVIALIAWIFW